MSKTDRAVLSARTLMWIGNQLNVGERVVRVDTLHGGFTADVRNLTIGRSNGVTRNLVLRRHTDPTARHQAAESVARESDALTLLAESGIPAPTLVAVDPGGIECEFPSLLMSYLPGRTMLFDDGLAARVTVLARQLVAIHGLRTAHRPPAYSTLSTADTAVIPDHADPEVWAAAIGVIRRTPPWYEGRILHRDFQPGNVLFDAPTGTRITGVVDWSGLCWGPADLDVAHCSTNLALLHGPEWGARFADVYEEVGGVLADAADSRRYWQVRDALACSEEVHLWAAPWRRAGRTDLTDRVVEERLTSFLSLLVTPSR